MVFALVTLSDCASKFEDSMLAGALQQGSIGLASATHRHTRLPKLNKEQQFTKEESAAWHTMT